MKIIKSLTIIATALILCDIITTIIGLNMGLVESNAITIQFLNQFGNIMGLIISSILKLSLIGIILIINKFNIIVPQTIMNICVSTILIVAIITTLQAVLNNISLIMVLL